MTWVGYLHVPVGGSYAIWVEGGMGAVSVPNVGFVTFGGQPATVTLPEAGDYPINLYAEGNTDPAAAFHCTGGTGEASLRPMAREGVM